MFRYSFPPHQSTSNRKMKIIAKFTAWLFALSAVSQAYAVNYIYITGAQSDRPNVQSAILHALGVANTVVAPSTVAGTAIPNGNHGEHCELCDLHWLSGGDDLWYASDHQDLFWWCGWRSV